MALQHSTHTTTGWTSWVIFGSFLMGVAGLFQIVAGLAALFQQGVFLVAEESIAFLSFQQWGWTHLILGSVLILGAFSLASGRMWARILAVTFATMSAIANFAFMSAYPLWAITIIFVDLMLIYSVIVHGGELKED